MPIAQPPVKITAPGKVLFPEAGITKGDLIAYYRRVGDHMLPHVKDRPITLVRYPQGIHGPSFFQKEASNYFPAFIERVTVPKEGGETTYALCDDVESLTYFANLTAITFHIWLSRTDKLTYPDRMIIDLDPNRDDFALVRQTAWEMKALLEELGLPAYLMTTGSRGLHVVTPLDRSADFDTVRDFARDLASVLVARHPDELTMEQYKAKRQGRLSLDVARNAYAQTAVAPYSVRAKPGAPVAVPLHWDELKDETLRSNSFNIHNVFDRLQSRPDPWADIFAAGLPLTQARAKLDRMVGD